MLGREFQTYLEVERKYSLHTIKAYIRDLSAFQEFITNTYEFDVCDPAEVDMVNHRMIRAWMGELHDAGVSNRSMARKIASLNSYFRYLRKAEKLDKNPATKVKVPKFEKKL
ncbi:MAG: site-specific integrase, partial [Bacteroidota bacterium]